MGDEHVTLAAGQIVNSSGSSLPLAVALLLHWPLARRHSLVSRSIIHRLHERYAHFHPYAPVNSPAIGDLFDMFDFGRGAKNAHQEDG